MSQPSVRCLPLAAVTFALGCADPAAPLPEVTREFTGVEVVTVYQAQGWTRVEPAAGDRVSVDYAYGYPATCYAPGLTQTGALLALGGIFEPVACTGHDEIVLRVPVGVRVEYFGAQSDLTLENVAVEVVAFSSFGRTVARNVTFTGPSSLGAAVGDVLVTLGQSLHHDLVLLSNSGRASLNYGGHPVSGRFELSVKENVGTIVSPYAFDAVESYDCQCEPGVTMFVRKSFMRSLDQPLVRISSGTGVAELKLQ